MGVMNGIFIIRTPAMPVKGEGGLECNSFSTFVVQHPCQDRSSRPFFLLFKMNAGACIFKGLPFLNNSLKTGFKKFDWWRFVAGGYIVSALWMLRKMHTGLCKTAHIHVHPGVDIRRVLLGSNDQRLE
jgi:hypothetical protein